MRMKSGPLTRWQRIIIAAHAVLALLYGAVIPPYEAHDETGHFDYIVRLRTSGALPSPAESDRAFLDQAHQPPVYYLAAAALTSWTDLSDYARPQRNSFAFDGTNRRGVRILLRQPGEAFPWRGSVLALHAARAVSALFGALTLLCISASAALIYGERARAAALATAIAAFNPQAIYMSAMVNNDAAVGLFGAALAYCALRIAVLGDTRTRVFVGFGAALGLAVASKNAALALIGFAALFLLIAGWRAHWPQRIWISGIASAALAAAVFIGPHMARNLSIGGRLWLDRAADNAAKLTPEFLVAGLSQGWQDSWLPRLFINAFRTFWGTFGWGNVQQPEAFYALTAVLCAAAIALLALRWRGLAASVRRGLLTLAGLLLSMMVLPAYRAIAFQNPDLLPGRYLMPALASVACLLVAGLSSPAREQASESAPARRVAPGVRELTRSLPLLGCLCAALWALLIPFVVLQPAYQPFTARDNAAPPILRYADANDGPIAELLSADAEVVTINDREGPRPYARVKLTWRALRSTSKPYAVNIAVLGSGAEALGSINAYSARGNYPSTVWQPSTIFYESYDILLEKPCARLPALGRLSVVLFEPKLAAVGEQVDVMGVASRLESVDAAGAPVAPVTGRFKVDRPRFAYPVFWQEPAARFDGVIGLRAAQAPTQTLPGAALTVTLTFESLGRLERDATFFVHLLDANGALVAQADRKPGDGAYPTQLWDAGECTVETAVLNVPADARGPLKLLTGWYDATGRLRATAGAKVLPDDLFPIAEIALQP